MEVYKEELSIEVAEIKMMMDLLSNLFSIRASLIYAINEEQYTNEIAGNNGDYQDFCKLIQLELKHKCIACDRDKFKEANKKKEPLLYRCYNGLYEMYLPLLIDNYLIGYLHFGQVRAEKDFKVIADECSLHEHSRIADIEKSYNSMIFIEKEKLILISALFQQFADIILKNKLVELKKAKPEYYLRKYVEENLDKPIDVNSAAEFIGMSISFVTHKFKEIYGISFHEYLSRARIDRSKKLLQKNSISETFLKCGFNNRYHFSKVFKKIEGVTPHEFQLSSNFTGQ
ncbi:two-component response regulator yesN [Aquipluma nitroreducens]|uniref:Two-component response regulator yesN n=1 Tax=Aquipluma nitroreducens TaxID=2010828 RepID=A0A5K7S3N4_9BACT|nr:PocR ligand-binding domain-containing protein [Aquipluma nitroreducens]BBE16152.1 two-component response regulator yesN [Aquipluma nitroreducens]